MSDTDTKAAKAFFGRRYTLSASHRLHVDTLTVGENRAAYGKCNNPHGHGHNYVVEVLVGGPVDSETGMVINLADLDRVVNQRVLERFDHRNLNLDPTFAKKVPTTENLSLVVVEILQDALPVGSLEHVRIEETENNFFECYGAGSISP
ncbi:MAG: 6-carboxytetrahydropterin synthase [Terracidiphilus sp.]